MTFKKQNFLCGGSQYISGTTVDFSNKFEQIHVPQYVIVKDSNRWQAYEFTNGHTDYAQMGIINLDEYQKLGKLYSTLKEAKEIIADREQYHGN